MADHRTTRLSDEIRDLGLEPYVLDLEVDGLAVVPPDVHGVTEEQIDAMAGWILGRAEEMVGCPFDLERGPAAEVTFPADDNVLAEMSGDRGATSQFLIQQLARQHRMFRDLAVNPVAVALIRHLIGRTATRFSSHNSFVKWQGAFGYGRNLGLHCDQSTIPLPWGRGALTANTNWCLTDYTFDGGALAYVPGSHTRATRPTFPEATQRAVPCEAPKGSLLVFHGATWHGAFPRTIPGMRLSIANYYRHAMITSQEDIQGSFPHSLVDDCDDPESFRTLAGFDDVFPYRSQRELVPRVAGAG
ncbi:MAG: phytanoyl-CoA dioxygenase family protein [Actinomycetota bacterium]